MLINTNLAGTGGTPLAKPSGRSGSTSKTTAASDNSSSPTTAATLTSEVSQTLASASSDIPDFDVAAGTQFVRTHILQQSSAVMQAQANLSPETVLKLLQE